jgi:hypothetical protein
LAWPPEKRAKFIVADHRTREKMMMGALSALTESVGQKAHVTRGEPGDHD